MNQTQALAKLRKIIGPKLGYRIDPKAPTGEEREVMRAHFQEATAIVQAAEAARMARYNELLNGDAQYQLLKVAAKAAGEAKERTKSNLYRKRITIGVNNSLYFSVRADGDNWDEVVGKVIGDKS